MDEDEELERAMLSITPSKLQVQSSKYTDPTLNIIIDDGYVCFVSDVSSIDFSVCNQVMCQ